MGYNKVSTIEKIASFEKADFLYNQNFVNWRGKTNDSHEWYTEVIAEQLLSEEGIHWLDSIKTITRNRDSYFNEEHSINKIIITDSNRKEENMAKCVVKLKQPFKSVGLMIDYQVPLKNKSEDEAGKVDLVSFDADTNAIRLFELKLPDRYKDAPETLLRCVLESYTYFKTIDHVKLIRDLPDKLERVSRELIDSGHEDLVKYTTIGCRNDFHVESHILIAKNDLQHSNLITNNSNYHPNVVELMNKLRIIPYVYVYKDQNGSPIITNIEKNDA